MSKTYIFYRLFNLNFDECYVGTTTNYKNRMIAHKSDCSNSNNPNHNLKVYKFIRANQGFENWQFEIIDEQILNHKEALNIESEFIMIYSASLNTDVPGRTTKEWGKQYYINNKEKICERRRQRYLNNKDIERNKQYYINNKEKICERKKQYYLDNKDKISERHKQYYLDNKDKFNERYLKNKEHINE